jgi:hypothetical protein
MSEPLAVYYLDSREYDIQMYDLDAPTPPSPPAGYKKEGYDILLHTGTGIRCSTRALDDSQGNDEIVLYHYCPKDAFMNIVSTGAVHPSTRLGSDCDFGVGYYATAKPPHAFQSVQEVIYNNYPRATLKYSPGDPDFPSDDRAMYCVPIIVDMSQTPAFPLSDANGARGRIIESKDRHGRFDAKRHNIWLVDYKAEIKSSFLDADHLNQREVALFAAVGQGNVEVVKELIAEGASVNAELRGGCEVALLLQKFGNSALYGVCSKKRIEIAKLLLAAGASPNQRTGVCGRTVLEELEHQGRLEEAAILREAKNA